MSRDRAEARKKGWIALSAWIGTGVLAVYHHLFAVIVAAAPALLTWRWFMYRAKRGMRF
jgi:hypothetical protein